MAKEVEGSEPEEEFVVRFLVADGVSVVPEGGEKGFGEEGGCRFVGEGGEDGEGVTGGWEAEGVASWEIQILVETVLDVC